MNRKLEYSIRARTQTCTWVGATKLNQLQAAEESIPKTLNVYPFDTDARYEPALFPDQANAENALERLRVAVDVWKEADAGSKPDQRARPRLAEVQASTDLLVVTTASLVL